MLKLSDREWKSFTVESLFTVTNIKPRHENQTKLDSKGIPYVTRKSTYNGVKRFVSQEDGIKPAPGNVISLGAENADFFYQPRIFYAGNKMYYISHNRLNKHSGLFVQQIFKSSISRCGFGYGKGLTGTRFKSRKIMLPVDSSGNPDWDFMEAYMRQEEKKILDQVVPHLQQKLLDNLMAVGGYPGRSGRPLGLMRSLRVSSVVSVSRKQITPQVILLTFHRVP